jgi:leader peptidase (prepilin peptidase)/N-methyltransferase
MGRLWFAVTLRLAGQGLGWAVPAYLALAFVCLVLAVIDAATGLLPNRITYPAFPVVAGLLLAASLGLGRAWPARSRPARGGLGRRVVPAAGSARHGVGDVKLAPTLGLALGWLSWGTVAVGVVAGFLLGGLAGLGGMLALGLSRTARLPFFGPWSVAGALLGVLVGGEVAGWFQASSLGAR